jgi:hypothetical protein
LFAVAPFPEEFTVPRKFIAALFVAVLAASLMSPLTASAVDGPTVVGTDAYGDWGGGGDNAVVGHVAGQDLTSATIDLTPGNRVDFTIGVSYLPSPGGVPEASRYTWDMHLVHFDPSTNSYKDPKFLELDGKFTNYSRGACDPTAGSCPPPRDPGQQPFAVRGDCVANEQNVTTCKEIGLVKATFAPAAKTITIPVPTALMGLAPCSAIMAGPNIFGGSISAAPSAFVSSSGAPLDFLDVADYVQVPSADGTPCPALPEF